MSDPGQCTHCKADAVMRTRQVGNAQMYRSQVVCAECHKAGPKITDESKYRAESKAIRAWKEG